MRGMEFMFRVWNSNKKTWQTRMIDKTSIFFQGWESGMMAVRLKQDDSLIRNDCIGYGDQNGCPIFEDDIVRLKIPTGVHWTTIVGVVKFFTPLHAIVSTEGIFPISEEDRNNIVIIGNIREDHIFVSKKNPLRLRESGLVCQA